MIHMRPTQNTNQISPHSKHMDTSHRGISRERLMLVSVSGRLRSPAYSLIAPRRLACRRRTIRGYQRGGVRIQEGGSDYSRGLL